MKILGHKLSDFLMFSQEIYRDQIVTLNNFLWPAQIIAFLFSIFLIYSLLVRSQTVRRAANIIYALSWLSAGVLFHYTAYSPVNWLAFVYVLFFALQSILMLLLLRSDLRLHEGNLNRICAFCLSVYGFLLHPIITAALYGGTTTEIWGLHPTPTVIASLGLILLVSRQAFVLSIIPFLYIFVECTLAWELGLYEVLSMAGAAFLFFFTLLCRKYERL